MQRLDDAEFGRRQRERNLRANRQRRERLTAAGFCQWNLWIAEDVRQRAERLAIERGQSPSDLITDLVKSAALPALSGPARAVNSLPLFDAPAPVDRDSRIRALKQEHPDLSNYAIAARVGCSEPTVRRVLKRLPVEATV